jgi:mono/diheme cytochrome c family protein
MKRRWIALISITALVLAAAPAALASPDAAALYKAKCASCHGPDGGGMTPVGKSMKLRDLRSAEVQKLTDKELRSIIADGKGKMPGYKAKVTAADLDALVQCVRKMKK